MQGCRVGGNIAAQPGEVHIVENGEVSCFYRRAPLSLGQERRGQRRLEIDDLELSVGGANKVGVGVGVMSVNLPHRQPGFGEDLGHLAQELFRRIVILRFLASHILGDELELAVPLVYRQHRRHQVLAEPVLREQAGDDAAVACGLKGHTVADVGKLGLER
tara:strand:+ start:3630 stop:4112 length:483 start_codon:yes stop_codon:yes gene_type:complete